MNGWVIGGLTLMFFAVAWAVDSVWSTPGLVLLTMAVLGAPCALTATLRLHSRLTGSPTD